MCTSLAENYSEDRDKCHDTETPRSFPDILSLIWPLIDDSRTHEVIPRLGFFQMLMMQTSLGFSNGECSVNLAPTLCLDRQTDRPLKKS